MKAGAFSPKTIAIVTERAGEVCERCRAAPIEQIHHRRPRGSGGSRKPSTAGAANAAALCFPCHNWVEREDRTEAGRLGWIVPQAWEPADVPVWLDGHWVTFNDNGGVHAIPEGAN